MFHVDQVDLGEKESGPNEMRLRQAWSKKHRTVSAFHIGRAGDHLLTPFQCDWCIFLRLKERYPLNSSHQDKLLMDCIRRASLDAFWSRASSTVEANKRRVEKQLKLSATVGLSGPYTQQEGFPDFDHCGFEVAIGMLLYSRGSGKNSMTHTQFGTIRSLRSAFSNQVRASAISSIDNLSMSGPKGKYQKLSRDVCGSYWFSKFIEGISSRMGSVYKPNRAMSPKLLNAFFNEVHQRLSLQDNLEDLHDWTIFLSYSVLSYVLSLRGSEGFLIDLKTLNGEWNTYPENYLIIPLLGRLKGETGDTLHRLPCVNITKSGLNIRETISNLINIKKRLNFTDGPAISDIRGKVLSSQTINEKFHEVLIDLYRSQKNLFPPDIKSEEIIQKEYMSFRSFRRSSDTQALNAGVSPTDITIVNRWSLAEIKRSKKTTFDMMHLYAQVDLLLKPFLRYTKEM